MLITVQRSITQKNHKNYSEKLISIDINPTDEILKIKQILEKETQIDICHQMLFYRGRILVNEQKVNYYNLMDGHKVAIIRSSSPCTCLKNDEKGFLSLDQDQDQDQDQDEESVPVNQE